MKSLLFVLLFCSGVVTLSFSQQDTLNHLDSKGKKDGIWIEYINSKWKQVQDSSHASYFRYTYYDHGCRVQGKPRRCKLNHTLEYTGGVQQNKKLKLMDGEYKWLDKKGSVVSIEVFKKGTIISDNYFAWHLFNLDLLGYNRKLTGKLHEDSDFTKQYNGQPHTWYTQIYDKKGTVQQYYVRKTEKYGWVGVFENSTP
ncbi:MAG TPA: hypothetical protein VNZ86_05225 [Bacteroidia bacterium]|jgi:hypothetical protein|nr:hypothetical protein [Bacteroidia bacterium]